jgi:shikimate dehydrogenase
VTDRRRAAVLGRPIGHSLSPVLHRAAYAALGLDWEYRALECSVAELPATLARLAADHAGASLTMPLKLAAVSLVGRLEPPAGEIGAVNTVLFEGVPAQRWRGANTDVAGVRCALDELGRRSGVDRLPAGPVLILGAGGAARAALGALAAGTGTGPVTVAAREPARAAPLVELAARLGIACRAVPLALLPSAAAGAELIISTLPPAGAAAVAPDLDPWPGAALCDVVYDGWPTPLARSAGAAGCPVIGGLAMLVGQAAEAVRLMTGSEPPVAAMWRAGQAALEGRLSASAGAATRRSGSRMR